ncbi:DUF3515 domain-containing protein [Streptomyces phytohabitans]|uniref:DUF3515 domain-containing protein n=1 Tax=Streptomyces phytohabitans TaxID=1150371 RepID=UPI00345C1280
MSSARRRAARPPLPLPLAVCTAVVVAAAGCSPSDGGAGPAAPSPSGRAAAVCRALHGKLPERVNGQERTEPDPASDFTAAWGDPTIGLRCGVPRPEVLTPGSEHYNPTSDAAEVNGVSWLIEQRAGGYRFTTTDRAAFLEVTVPDAYAPEVGALTDLAAAVRSALPLGTPPPAPADG